MVRSVPAPGKLEEEEVGGGSDGDEVMERGGGCKMKEGRSEWVDERSWGPFTTSEHSTRSQVVALTLSLFHSFMFHWWAESHYVFVCIISYCHWVTSVKQRDLINQFPDIFHMCWFDTQTWPHNINILCSIAGQTCYSHHCTSSVRASKTKHIGKNVYVLSFG